MIMEHVVKLLENVDRVLVYNTDTILKLMEAGYKATPYKDVNVDIEDEDRVPYVTELAGFMIER